MSGDLAPGPSDVDHHQPLAPVGLAPLPARQARRHPLDDHASLYVAASQSDHHRPCIGLTHRFAEPISEATLRRWTTELAGNPKGFGRRVVSPRVPGARPRWEPNTAPPPLHYVNEPLSDYELGRFVEDEVSSTPDPAGAGGWRVAAARTVDGGTLVTMWVNHAYGDARGILATAFGVTEEDHADAGHQPYATPHVAAELGEVARRLRHGVGGAVRLGWDAAGSWRSSSQASEVSRLAPTIAALWARDRGVGTRSGLRHVSTARIGLDDWKQVARANGGSNTALLLAVVRNMVNGARQARGETEIRPMRILVPVDLRGRANRPSDKTANAAGAAMVTLEGDGHGRNELGELRAVLRQAIDDACQEAETATNTAPPGMVDAMRLLPSGVANRAAVAAQATDGVASNVGLIPQEVCRIGSHVATETHFLGGPMMTDLTIVLAQSEEHMSIGVVADAARLGPGGALADRLAGELDAWDLPARVS